MSELIKSIIKKPFTPSIANDVVAACCLDIINTNKEKQLIIEMLATVIKFNSDVATLLIQSGVFKISELVRIIGDFSLKPMECSEHSLTYIGTLPQYINDLLTHKVLKVVSTNGMVYVFTNDILPKPSVGIQILQTNNDRYKITVSNECAVTYTQFFDIRCGWPNLEEIPADPEIIDKMIRSTIAKNRTVSIHKSAFINDESAFMNNTHIICNMVDELVRIQITANYVFDYVQ